MRLRGRGIFCAFVVYTVFCGVRGVALAENGTTDAYTLGEVLVTAPNQEVQKIQTEHTVTAEEIEERGARTLDEALALVPGVNVRHGRDGIPQIDIRGFRTRDVTLLLDGVPFNSNYNGRFDPSAIPVEYIAKIEVTTGGQSVLYGQGGNGGVINIITKKGTPGLQGTLQGEGGQGGEYLTRGTLSTGTDKVDAFVSGSIYGQEGYLLSDSYSPTKVQPQVQPDGLRFNSYLYRDNAFANVGFTPSSSTSLGLTYANTTDDRGDPPVAVHNNEYIPPKKWFSAERSDSENNVVQLALNHDFGGPFSMKAWGYYNQLDMLDNVYNNSRMDSQTNLGSSSTTSSTKISGANVQLRGDFEKYGLFTSSFMVEDDEYDAIGFAISSNDKGQPNFDLDKAYQLYSGLFQYEVSPIRRLGLVAGVGLFDQERDGGSAQNYSYLLGAHYDLLEGTRFKINTSRRVRFPTLRDLYDPVLGNLLLVPETSLNYEAGIEQKLPCKTVCSLTGFITNAHDFIAGSGNGFIGMQPNPNLAYTQNIDEYHFRGFEVNVENKYVQNLSLRASYSFLHALNESPDRTTEVLQYRPQNMFTLEGNYRFFCGTSLNVSMLLVADQYAIGRSDPPPLLEIPTYTVLDAKLNQSLMHNHLDVYIGVRNLLDENYYDNYGYPQAGRMIYGGMTYKFGPGRTDNASH